MAVITRDQAVTIVSDRCAADKFPQLEHRQIEDLVDASARKDAGGNSPSDDGWTPTYDLNSACADGWELKAAEVANRFDANIDRQGLTRSQVFDMCLKMASRYRSRVVGAAQKAQPDSIFSRDGLWNRQVQFRNRMHI